MIHTVRALLFFSSFIHLGEKRRLTDKDGEHACASLLYVRLAGSGYDRSLHSSSSEYRAAT